MERVLKENSSHESANAKRVTQGRFAPNSPQGDIASRINNSPHMIAQRKKLQSLFGGAAQLQGAEDELLQGKFETAQRMEEEELLQGKFEPVQRVEEEEPLQGKFALQTPAQLEQQPAAKPNNTGLPDNLKSGIENLSGISMDNVKVHYNSSQPTQLNALAYAQGTDIHVAPGQEQHLPHEAWHIVQQAQGRVKPTMQMKDGVPVNDDKGLEREADAMGERALSVGTPSSPSQFHSINVAQANVVTAQLLPKQVDEGATHHYTDGWGALYGIVNDDQLKNKVTSEEEGSWTKDLGRFYHPVEGVTRPCTIGYKNTRRMTYIKHAGPSNL